MNLSDLKADVLEGIIMMRRFGIASDDLEVKKSVYGYSITGTCAERGLKPRLWKVKKYSIHCDSMKAAEYVIGVYKTMPDDDLYAEIMFQRRKKDNKLHIPDIEVKRCPKCGNIMPTMIRNRLCAYCREENQKEAKRKWAVRQKEGAEIE